MQKGGYVYILGSLSQRLYVGVTSDLLGRVWEHKQQNTEGFTKRYHIHRLLYYEAFDTIESAIEREKQMKHWKRAWKLEIISRFNPDFKDLYVEIVQEDYRSSLSQG